MGYSHRFRWSPFLLVTLGLVLCSVLCLGFTSAATRERKNIQNNWSRPDRLRDQEESYYYTEESKDYYNKRRSPSPPPTTDDDYFEKRRGAFGKVNVQLKKYLCINGDFLKKRSNSFQIPTEEL